MELINRFGSEFARLWQTEVLGVNLGSALVGPIILCAFVLTRRMFAQLALSLPRWIAGRNAPKVSQPFIDAIDKPLQFVFIVAGLSIALYVAYSGNQVPSWVGTLTRSLITFAIFWALLNAVEPLSFLFDQLLSRLHLAESARETLLKFCERAIKILIFALGGAAILQEWGINVAALLGGLGLAGIAVALAAKDMVANLLSAALIFTNRIFEKGNWIKTPRVEGTVDELGLMTTKIRQFDKALVTVENRILASDPITNFSRMTNRRIYWEIGLEYNTSQEQLRAIVRLIHDHIHEHEDFETNPQKVPTFVFVDAFAASSINIMLYCFTKTTDWGEWLALKEALALKIKEIVAQNGASFAFPSTSLYVEQWPLGRPEAFPKEVQSSDQN